MAEVGKNVLCVLGTGPVIRVVVDVDVDQWRSGGRRATESVKFGSMVGTCLDG